MKSWRRGSPSAAFGVTLALAMALAIVAIGCGATPATSPAGTAPSASTSRSQAPTATIAPSANPSAATSGGVAVDPTLLAHLPATIGGIALEPDPDTAGQIAADPTLGDSAEGLAVARAVGGSTQDDLVVVSVVDLRPGVFTDDFYATWRATYDEAACAPAGGVQTSIERTIGPRTAFVGTCNGGATTYHAHVGEDILVSVLAVGDQALGEVVVAGIH